MEFIAASKTEYQNAELRKATKTIYKLGEGIKNNWFKIAYIVALVDRSDCYFEDGFTNVHEWVASAFGLKKSASYALLTIGRDYVKTIVGDANKIIGYRTNLVPQDGDDFNKTQVEKLLPLGHDMAKELVDSGMISPNMTVKAIADVVRKTLHPESAEARDVSESDGDETATDGETNSTDCELILVCDAHGNKYEVPENILTKYIVEKGGN